MKIFPIMKIYSKIKRLFFVQYRLTVYYHGEAQPRNIYAANLRLLQSMAHHTAARCWTIYKSGPLFLPEREIDSSS